MSTIQDTLNERGSNYGPFGGHAFITQRMKRVMQSHPQYATMSSAHREALEMIVHKIGRIINGNANYPDSWIDISGYAELGNQACEDQS